MMVHENENSSAFNKGMDEKDRESKSITKDVWKRFEEEFGMKVVDITGPNKTFLIFSQKPSQNSPKNPELPEDDYPITMDYLM